MGDEPRVYVWGEDGRGCVCVFDNIVAIIQIDVLLYIMKTWLLQMRDSIKYICLKEIFIKVDLKW